MNTAKKKSVILAAAMAVLMILMSVYGLKASAEAVTADAPQEVVLLTGEETAEKMEVPAEEKEIEEADESAEAKSSGLATGIVLVVAVGAIVICLREIHRDNKRP